MELGRLHVIIDVSPHAPHPVVLAEAALAGGAPVLQVRPKGVTDAVAYEAVTGIAQRCRAAGAACIVNDRADLALAVIISSTRATVLWGRAEPMASKPGPPGLHLASATSHSAEP